MKKSCLTATFTWG